MRRVLLGLAVLVGVVSIPGDADACYVCGASGGGTHCEGAVSIGVPECSQTETEWGEFCELGEGPNWCGSIMVGMSGQVVVGSDVAIGQGEIGSVQYADGSTHRSCDGALLASGAGGDRLTRITV